MRVKRLEILGFKSFKDKTVIHFDHSVTGIVGPNGCGKSNIVDAFFWVMGEQSYKHMRGSGSGDLIFNGSSKYSPLGLAEATLVFEKDVVDTESEPAGATASDTPVKIKKEEVSVTRRVYRDGEGEYFLNGVQCRLKDIKELFMDTGIGAKGYSVIEQGQIDKVVNSKPEDRRLLIEEAAGIAKYKARKKESLRKIEATQANLSRLNDVVSEMERQMNSLERQAQKALKYKQYKDELFEKEITWGRRKAKVITQKLDELKSEGAAAEQELVALKSELQTIENKIEVDRIAQVTDQKLNEELQEKIQELSRELTQEQSALELSKRRQEDLASQLEALANEKVDLEKSIETEKESLAGKESELAGFDEVLANATQKANDADEQAKSYRTETDSFREGIEKDKQQLMDLVARQSEYKSAVAVIDARVESGSNQVTKLENQQTELQNQLTENKQKLDQAQNKLDAAQTEKNVLFEQKNELDSQFEKVTSDLDTLEQKKEESNQQVTSLQSKLESLEELAAAYEGVGDGPKAVLDWARSQQNEQYHLLANAFNVQKDYERALEGLLENKLEGLLTTNAQASMSALDYIKQNQLGRTAIHLFKTGDDLSFSWNGASFVDVQNELRADFEVLGQLRDFVTVDDSFKALTQVIAKVCVVRDFNQLQSWLDRGSATALGSWAVVSLDGSVLEVQDQHHIVFRSGQSNSDDSTTLLGRKRAIEELSVEVKSASERLTQVSDELKQTKERSNQLQNELQEIETKIQYAEIEMAKLERDAEQLTRVVQELEPQTERVLNERQSIEQDISTAQQERSELVEKQQQADSEKTEIESRVSSDDSNLQERLDKIRELESNVQQLRIEEASLQERSSSLGRELEAARSVITDRENRLGDIDNLLERVENEKSNHSGSDEGIQEKIEQLTKTLGIAREDLSSVKDRLEQITSTLSQNLDRIKELHQAGDSKTERNNQIAVEVEKLNGEMSHLVLNLEEKYGKDCLEQTASVHDQNEMDQPVVTTEMTAEEEQQLFEDVEKLRERIRRLGEVNPLAAEEYEDIKGRYDGLIIERSDLENSIENLQEAIEHINVTSEERFKKAFQAISERFEKLYPIIFGGGSARLSLLFPEGTEDVLEAGVDIMAQPPGKKVVNIGLLSGGEKALTAISLVFAIFMVKPSPFCVLDEVDAPLDDSNIGKFNALLREMSSKSQFIIITHNKKTMELNDTLYGVTMEEPGVSKMVSIELQ